MATDSGTKTYENAIGIFPWCMGKVKLVEGRWVGRKGGYYSVHFEFMRHIVRLPRCTKPEAERTYNFLIDIIKHLF